MPKFLIASLFIFLTSLSFSQANSDYARIKKEGIREVKLYRDKKDSFPDAALYYDESGRLRKWISILDYEIDPPFNYEINISEFDSLGRLTLSRHTFCGEKNIDDAVFIPDNDYVTAYSYSGDSSVIENDSAWQNKRLVETNYDKLTTYWKKTPPPFPRPILWQDSIQSLSVEIKRDYKYYYQAETGTEWIKVDSSGFNDFFSYQIRDGKLIGAGSSVYFKDDTVATGTSQKIYTLNQKYDTVTWINNSKRIPASKADIINHFDDYHYLFKRTLETKRRGKKFVINCRDYYTNEKGNMNMQRLKKATSKNPWNDYRITTYFENENNFSEDLSIKNAKNWFGCSYAHKILY